MAMRGYAKGILLGFNCSKGETDCGFASQVRVCHLALGFLARGESNEQDAASNVRGNGIQ